MTLRNATELSSAHYSRNFWEFIASTSVNNWFGTDTSETKEMTPRHLFKILWLAAFTRAEFSCRNQEVCLWRAFACQRISESHITASIPIFHFDHYHCLHSPKPLFVAVMRVYHASDSGGLDRSFCSMIFSTAAAK